MDMFKRLVCKFLIWFILTSFFLLLDTYFLLSDANSWFPIVAVLLPISFAIALPSKKENESKGSHTPGPLGHEESYQGNDVEVDYTIYCYGYLFRIIPDPGFPYSDHINMILSSNSVLSDNVNYDLTDEDSIRSIAIPRYDLHSISSTDKLLGLTGTLEYALRMKGEKYWEEGKYDLAIACYDKSTQLMCYSDSEWPDEDFFLVVERLEEIGKLEKAQKWEKWLDKHVFSCDEVCEIEDDDTRKAIRPNSLSIEESQENSKSNPIEEDDVHKAAKIIVMTGQASISLLQRKFCWSYSRAARAMDNLEKAGVVGPFLGSTPRKILITKEEYQRNYKIVRHNQLPIQPQVPSPEASFFEINVADILKDEAAWRKEQMGKAPIEQELDRIDSMDGHTFERWCARLLEASGFKDVEVTRGSGDQGVDVLATLDGVRYAVQCKCYASDLGNKPVQEVYAGIAIYKCQLGSVMTNRRFTSGAKELAEATGISLWDRDWIISLLEELDEDALPL